MSGGQRGSDQRQRGSGWLDEGVAGSAAGDVWTGIAVLFWVAAVL